MFGLEQRMKNKIAMKISNKTKIYAKKVERKKSHNKSNTLFITQFYLNTKLHAAHTHTHHKLFKCKNGSGTG